MGRERDCSRPFYFPCGCDFPAGMSPRHGGPGGQPPSGSNSRQPHQFPLSKPRTSLCSRVSKTQLAWGSTRAACQFPIWGRGRQVMHLPCKQAHMGADPSTPPFHCGENEIQASLISSASVGATPTPATNLGRCSGGPTVNRASQNMCRKRRTGALPAPPTISDP